MQRTITDIYDLKANYIYVVNFPHRVSKRQFIGEFIAISYAGDPFYFKDRATGQTEAIKGEDLKNAIILELYENPAVK